MPWTRPLPPPQALSAPAIAQNAIARRNPVATVLPDHSSWNEGTRLGILRGNGYLDVPARKMRPNTFPTIDDRKPRQTNGSRTTASGCRPSRNSRPPRPSVRGIAVDPHLSEFCVIPTGLVERFP